jgi:iron complex transport system ATP-binding protein
VINDIVIKTNNLSVGYQIKNGFSEILNSINLTCYQSELIALIGENGSGKSTLLKTFARLSSFRSGNILFRNNNELIDIQYLNKKDFAKKLSFVSTEIIKVENLTVYDVVALGRFPYTNWFGALSESDSRIINHSIDLVGLGNFKNKNINEISDGERQKVMIARTLAQDTEIIILDEPTAFLDLPNRYELISLLSNLSREKKKTIIFSTHDLNLAIKEVDKIWLISNGNIYENAPEDLIISGKIDSVFKNDKIKLDRNSGEFILEKKYNDKIQLTGEGIYYNWTVKALNRIGYEVSGNEEINKTIIIKVNDQVSWSFKYNQDIKSFYSIYDLVYELRHII